MCPKQGPLPNTSFVLHPHIVCAALLMLYTVNKRLVHFHVCLGNAQIGRHANGHIACNNTYRVHVNMWLAVWHSEHRLCRCGQCARNRVSTRMHAFSTHDVFPCMPSHTFCLCHTSRAVHQWCWLCFCGVEIFACMPLCVSALSLLGSQSWLTS